MALYHFYLASCALLLTLSTSTGFTLRTLSAEKCEDCAMLYRNLLLNITELLKSDVLCYGIASDKVIVGSHADTVMACAPNLIQNSGCMVQRHSSFNETECLRNIMRDLDHYTAVVQSYLQSQLRSRDEEVALLSPTLDVIRSLRKNCSLMPNGENGSSEADAAQMWGDNTFDNRKKMCEMMRGFHVRTITINRAMGYIASGEHNN